jgi:hypothetical protein
MEKELNIESREARDGCRMLNTQCRREFKYRIQMQNNKESAFVRLRQTRHGTRLRKPSPGRSKEFRTVNIEGNAECKNTNAE